MNPPAKPTVVVPDGDALMFEVETAIKQNGPHCDLNHLDVSAVKHFFNLFRSKDFNGDISKWDVSAGTHFMGMFEGSTFSGDVSGWNMSGARAMTGMFADCPFDRDISMWTLPRLDKREGNRWVAHRNPQARDNLRLPLLDIPVTTLFNGTHATMQHWLAGVPHSRYHWDALLVERAPWASEEMVGHLEAMRPVFELVGLSGVALSTKLHASWENLHAPKKPRTAWPMDFDSPT